MDTKITIDTRLQRVDEHIVSTAMDNETVMMDMDSGDYMTLNSVGDEIWNELEEPKTVSELVTWLLESYNVDETTCLTETLAYVTDLLENRLVRIV